MNEQEEQEGEQQQPTRTRRTNDIDINNNVNYTLMSSTSTIHQSLLFFLSSFSSPPSPLFPPPLRNERDERERC
eukprot:m.115995 g.115995  ORF g.115995 m.115995 type:complete len:74 (-) comp15384_c0_seq1:2194-2415(-)